MQSERKEKKKERKFRIYLKKTFRIEINRRELLNRFNLRTFM